MNRNLALAIAVVTGLVAGAGLSLRPARASSTLLFGTVADSKLHGKVPMTVELRDPKSDTIVARRETEATVADGRYLAELGEPVPDGLYVVHIAASTGAPLQAATFVELQANSPGTKQTGNVNISGNLLAGKIGVPSVNAGAMINAIGTGGVSGLRGQSDGTGVLGSTTATAGAGVSGNATAPTGSSSGVIGFNSSPEGFGVRGNGGPGVGVRGQTTSATLPAVSGAGPGVGGRFVSTELGSFGVVGESTGVKGRGVRGSGDFGVEGQGVSGAAIGLSGAGKVGVQAIGESFGGTFEATSTESISVSAQNFATFGIGIHSLTTGDGSTGVFAQGTANGGKFFANGPTSAGVFAESRGTGICFGGDFEVSSVDGRGVRGKASAVSGATFGGWFTSLSPNGTGAIGTVNSTTGNTVGLHGTVNSQTGKGVLGEATATVGVNFGGDFVSNSDKGAGVRGRATSATGFTVGGFFTSASPSGSAVIATNTASTGAPAAIQGTSAAPGGNVLFLNNSASTGTATGVRAQVASSDAKAIVAQHFATNTNIEIGSKNGAVMYDKGHITKKFGANLFTMSPIAYGVVNANGTKAGGTNNWTVTQSQSQTKSYFINLTGQDLIENNFVCHVTQFIDSVSDPRFLPATTFDSQGANTVTVNWVTTAGAFASTKFHFIVYGQVPVVIEPPAKP